MQVEGFYKDAVMKQVQLERRVSEMRRYVRMLPDKPEERFVSRYDKTRAILFEQIKLRSSPCLGRFSSHAGGYRHCLSPYISKLVLDSIQDGSLMAPFGSLILIALAGINCGHLLQELF